MSSVWFVQSMPYVMQHVNELGPSLLNITLFVLGFSGFLQMFDDGQTTTFLEGGTKVKKSIGGYN